MGIERKTFEDLGLKIEKDRVFTYSKLSCPLECTYCFVDDMDVNFNQEKRGQMDMLRNLLQQHNQILFDGAAEAVKHLKEI